MECSALWSSAVEIVCRPEMVERRCGFKPPWDRLCKELGVVGCSGVRRGCGMDFGWLDSGSVW